ncbi:MAG: hypothetical protein QXL01_01545 [Thermoplasmatales archaeon]
MNTEQILEKIKKRLKKRTDHDLFYKGMIKARKVGLHEEYIESVHEILETGGDITLAVQAALDGWDIA